MSNFPILPAASASTGGGEGKDKFFDIWASKPAFRTPANQRGCEPASNPVTPVLRLLVGDGGGVLSVCTAAATFSDDLSGCLRASFMTSGAVSDAGLSLCFV